MPGFLMPTQVAEVMKAIVVDMLPAFTSVLLNIFGAAIALRYPIWRLTLAVQFDQSNQLFFSQI